MDIKEKSILSLEFNKITENIANFAKTSQSRELCLKALPFDDIVKIAEENELSGETLAERMMLIIPK